MGFTEHDEDIAYTDSQSKLINGGSVTYLAATGFSKFNRNAKANDASSSTQIEGMIDGSIITRLDLEARRYDNARVQILFLNWKDLTMGSLLDFTGTLGTVSIKEFTFQVELRPLGYLLTFLGGEICSPTCRVDFGSPRCAPGSPATLADGTTIDSLMQSGTVVSTDGYGSMIVSGISNTGKQFNKSLLTFSSGLNSGISLEVQQITFSASVTVKLFLRTTLLIFPGDTFDLMPGCDHLINGDCSLTYLNATNFQGEGFVPGADNELNYPDYHEPH